MLAFEKLEGPFRIPIYYQRMPDIIRSVSMAWVVFAGAADDELVGAPGLYHWLEHVPFCGTKKYPLGTDEIFTRYNGKPNARTNTLGTFYHVHVPLVVWKTALSVITDLFAQPLLREKDIEAERKIIGEEIKTRTSDSQGYAYYQFPKIIWPRHPYGHHTLGSEETLRSMNLSALRKAYELGYDRSRCALFFVGNIAKKELLAELENLSSILPDNGLSELRSPSSKGEMPWHHGGEITVEETTFNSSIVMMLFPVKERQSKATVFKNETIKDLFGFGGLGSPFSKIVREKYQLAYSKFVDYKQFPDGGYLNFFAETSEDKIDRVISAFKEVLKDPSVYSKERFEEVREGFLYSLQTMSFDPRSFQETAIAQLFSSGEVVNEKEMVEEVSRITLEDAKRWVQELNLDDARILVFKGMGK